MRWATRPGTQAKARLSRVSWSSRGLGHLGADKLVQMIGYRKREEGPREKTGHGEGWKSSVCKQEGHQHDRTQCPAKEQDPQGGAVTSREPDCRLVPGNSPRPGWRTAGQAGV